jgi:DNA primase
MQGINSEVIAEVRSRASLAEVISEHVVLKKAGKDYKGLCPFHKEKTPSFYVNVEKGIYKCFGCGEGGDIFSFIQKVKGLNFVDTVAELANKYGVQLIESQSDRQQYDRRVHILMLHQQAAQYYMRQLADPEIGRPAREYLKQRSISPQTIEKFELGYAPAAWDGLLRYLSSASDGNTSQILAQAGLARHREEGNSYYDLFRNRLIIPIKDDRGRVIAFGGRTMGDDQVKYLNSPETPIYTKGEHLFAFNLAKESIKERDAVIVVEGYFDAITMHQFGFTNAVATLGTALTDRQARQLVRYTESKRVYLCFDSDAAGARAVDRGVEMLQQIAQGVGIEMRVIHVPGGKDPDECLRAPDGMQSFTQAMQGAPLLLDYQLDAAVAGIDIATHTGRIEAAAALVPVLAAISKSVARGEYVRKWALQLGIKEEDLLSDVGYYRRRQGMQSQHSSEIIINNTTGRSAPRLGWLEAERKLLSLYFASAETYESLSHSLINEQLVDPAHEQIKKIIEALGSNFSDLDDLQQRVLDRLAPEPDISRAFV